MHVLNGNVMILTAIFVYLLNKGYSYDINIFNGCSNAYYIKNERTKDYFLVEINNTSFDCFIPFNKTSPKTPVELHTNTSMNIKPSYGLYYNAASNQVEANITWQLQDDMSSMHVYILRIQGDNSDNAVCFQVLVSKERGYFHGIHNFPTDISVNCLQISSPLDEPLYMSVLRVPSINQACADRHNELQQQNSCNAQLFTFSFTQDACQYWSQHIHPTLDLVVEYRRISAVVAHIVAVHLNPYARRRSVALFASDNPTVPLLEYHNRERTTSLRLSRKIDYFPKRSYYAVIYFYCDNDSSLATASFMTPLIDIVYGLSISPSPSSYSHTNDDNSAGKPDMVLVGSLVVVSCLVVGAVVGGVVFVKRRAGSSHTSRPEVHKEVMLPPANNSGHEIRIRVPSTDGDTAESSLLQPTYLYNGDNGLQSKALQAIYEVNKDGQDIMFQ